MATPPGAYSINIPVVHRAGHSAQVWIWGLLLVASVLFCYAPVFAGMARQWWNISFYSYAFLIPVISAYLAWARRAALAQVMPLPNHAGGSLVMICGLFALIVGQAGGIGVLQQMSLMVTLPGLILFLFGRAVLSVLALPLAFLWFMIPVWDVATEPLHFPFQSLSANLGVTFLRIVGIPVFQDGVFIYLPNITLEVAKSCSGVNYLIAVLATSIPLATLVLHDVRKRIALVIFAVMVSALANSLRVALIGWLAYYDMSGDLHGPYHTLHGMFVSMVGYVVIFLGLWFLSRGQSEAQESRIVPVRSSVKWKYQWTRPNKFAWSLLVGVFILAGSFRYIDRAQAMPLSQDLNALPVLIAGWQSSPDPFKENALGADQSLSRTYQNESGQAVRLSLWYYESQTQGKEVVNAMTAQLHGGVRTIELSTPTDDALQVNQVIQADERQRPRVLVFWYVINGRVITNPYAAKWYTAWDAIVHGRSAGALVYVSTEIESNDAGGRDRASALLKRFMASIYPMLQRYFHQAA